LSNSRAIRAISDDEKRTYEEDGIVCLRGLFSSDWVEELRDAAEISMQNPGELHAELAKQRHETGRFFHDTFIWQRNEVCRRFVFESPAAEIAAKMMRSAKINIFFDQWLIKEPGTTTKTPWHHDMTYWPIDGGQICTIWLALDAVSKESGAVEYVKGSHRWGNKYRPASFSGGDQYKEDLPDVPDIEANREQFEFAQFELEPGDCTVHHGLIVHGSPGNVSSERRRRAYVSRWAGDDVIFHPREGLQEMPPLPDLAEGDPLDSILWPRVLG
jgi:ectoine hydroxylase-related dioxygenase (phytanoyl-CoA dioxygenase family)